MSEESAQLEKIVSLLAQHDVQFVVIGGQAEYLFGGSRPTFDVDLCYAREPGNLKRLAECLRLIHAKLRGVPDDVPFLLDAKTLEMGCNFTFKTDIGDLDLLGYVEPIGDFQKIQEKREEYAVGDLRIATISLEDLLKVKLHINRAKDQESIAQLLAIKRIREGQKAP